MAMATTVLLQTFLKWNTGGVIRCHSEDGKVTSVWCSLCAKHSDKIANSSRFKGQVRKDLFRYINGTNFVTKHSVLRHLSSSVHSSAKQFEDLLESRVTLTVTTGTGDEIASESGQTEPTQSFRQPRIDTAITTASKEAYSKLFKTAYLMAVEGLPLSHFKTLVNIQKANGVQLITKCDNSDRANEFVSEIASSVRNKISNVTQSAGAFSLLTDGSQARKTGTEKELVLIRVVRDGTPLFFCIALQDIDEYGNADAANLKKSVDDIVMGENPKLEIGAESYTKKLVSMTSDGASVNTGIYGGLLTRMSNDDRDWLIRIHCVLHRTELALKDSILKTTFDKVHEFMVTIYYLFRNSGKFKRHFYTMGKVMGAQVYNFPKVQGTRFVSHQRRGLHHLLNNWIILAHTVEDCIENNRVTAITAKLRGVLKKLKDYEFLSLCVFFMRLLDSISKLSLTLQKDSLLISEVLPAIDRTKGECEDLKNNHPDTVGDMCKDAGFQLIDTNQQDDVTPPKYELKKKVMKAGHRRRKKHNRETVTVTMTGLTYVNKAAETINRMKAGTVADVSRCLDERFESFRLQIFPHINRILDPANWCDLEQEILSLQYVAKHFETTLGFSDFDMSKLISEWKDLKVIVKYNYQGVGGKVLWQKVFLYRKPQFRNLCLVVEILLCLGPSNGVVESGFSHLTGMLTDRRLSLNHSTMENLLIILVNDLLWSDADRESILHNAVQNFMSKKRRKVKLDTSSVSLLGASSRRRKRQKRGTAYSVVHITESSSGSSSEEHDSESDTTNDHEYVSLSESSSESSDMSDSEWRAEH